MHLGGYHAQQVVLQAQAVDRTYLVPLDYEAQPACETAGYLLLPMESYADGNVVEYEAGLAEEGGARDRVEGQFVVEGAVVVYLSVHPAHALGTGSVGYYLEGDFLGGHYADIYLRLLAGKPPYHQGIIFRTHRDFVYHTEKLLVAQFQEILLAGGDEESGHIRRTRTHGQVLIPFRIIMVGAQVRTQYDCGAEFPVLIPGIQVETGLALPFPARRALQQAVEELGHGFLGGSL